MEMNLKYEIIYAISAVICLVFVFVGRENFVNFFDRSAKKRDRDFDAQDGVWQDKNP